MIDIGKSQQKKGRSGELELVKVLNDHGFNVRPGRSLSYGSEPDITGLSGVHVECKRCEKIRLSEWMAQAVRDAVKFNDGMPVLFFRRNREPWLVTLRMTDFLDLYQAWKADD